MRKIGRKFQKGVVAPVVAVLGERIQKVQLATANTANPDVAPAILFIEIFLSKQTGTRMRLAAAGPAQKLRRLWGIARAFCRAGCA